MRSQLYDLKPGHSLLSYLKLRYAARRAAKGMPPLPAMPDTREVVAAQKATLAFAASTSNSFNTGELTVAKNLWAELDIE
jgi:hypothetical protein